MKTGFVMKDKELRASDRIARAETSKHQDRNTMKIHQITFTKSKRFIEK